MDCRRNSVVKPERGWSLRRFPAAARIRGLRGQAGSCLALEAIWGREAKVLGIQPSRSRQEISEVEWRAACPGHNDKAQPDLCSPFAMIPEAGASLDARRTLDLRYHPHWSECTVRTKTAEHAQETTHTLGNRQETA